MAFNPASPGTGAGEGVTLSVIMGNSLTFNVGDAVTINSSGFLDHAAAAAPILGIIIGFTTNAGGDLTPDVYVPGTATSSDVTTITTSSTNQTVALKKAIVETSMLKRFSAAVNGTLGSTVSSNQPGVRIDVDSAGSNYGRVLESTASRTTSVIGNFFSWGVDPLDSTRLIVSIATSLTVQKQA